mgnify:CR=1 FL=1
MKNTFEQFSGVYAILSGIAGFAYAVAFFIISRNNAEMGALLSGLFLLLTGLFATAALVAVYMHLRETSEGFALWALVLGLAGAVGMAIHGGYDLANAINPPGVNTPSLASLPSQIDPRGLLSFGVGGIALFTVSWLMGKNKFFPKNLSYLGYTSAVLLVILYLGRMILLDPSNPIIAYSALINGFLVNPAWYIWLGLILLRHERHG